MSANTSDGARLVSPADREGPEPDGALLAAAREMVQAYRDIEGDVTTGRSDAAFRALEAATPPPYLFTHHPAGQREDAPLDAAVLDQALANTDTDPDIQWPTRGDVLAILAEYQRLREPKP